MQKDTPETMSSPNRLHGGRVALELAVNNHSGGMSHICGLFSRRAHSLEKILCLPDKEGRLSGMWLQVDEKEKLDKVVKQ